MSFETFLEKLADVGITGQRGYGERFGQSTPAPYPYPSRSKKSSTEEPKPIPAIGVQWTTGGISGGSCYGGELHGWTSEEPPPAFEALDSLLEKICPEISYLKYKKLERLLHFDSFSRGEYYGNETNYAERWITLRELYDFLSEEGLCE